MTTVKTSDVSANSDAITYPGRTRIVRGALKGAAQAVIAGTLEVKASRVSVDLGDSDGGLTVTASTPLKVSAGDTNRIDQLHRDRDRIAREIEQITGATVAQVTLTITEFIRKQESRVT